MTIFKKNIGKNENCLTDTLEIFLLFFRFRTFCNFHSPLRRMKDQFFFEKKTDPLRTRVCFLINHDKYLVVNAMLVKY